jgi:acetylornithine deacetylase/succinyl-diaminopimelate desuccinylase-like protein
MQVIDGYFPHTTQDDDWIIITARGTVCRKQGIFAHLNSKKILFSVVSHAYDVELASYQKEEDDAPCID